MNGDAQLSALAEQLPHMLWVCDARGFLESCNARWFDYTGCAPPGHFLSPIHPAEHDCAQQSFLAAGDARGELAIEARYRCAADDRYRWQLLRALPLRDEGGEVLRWYGTCTDVDEQHGLQQSLHDAHARMDRFVATLGHELRNPLAALVASAQCLGSAADPSSSEPARLILRQAAHLKRLADALLDVSAISAGKILLNLAVVDLSEACAQCCEDYAAEALRCGVVLATEVPAERLLAICDPTRIRQCIDNLVSNAIKASLPGRRVRLVLRGNASTAEIMVSDEGCGIEPELRASLFRPHAQAEAWRGRGLGLGLSIVSRLIALQGGTVWVESAGRGRGATFGLRLPRHAGAMAAEVDASLHPDPRPRRVATVLVVDDQIDTARALQSLLALDGHDVQVAETGLSALTLAESQRPDVVICDLSLQGPMDGLEVAARLRVRFGHAVHLCAYSGHGARADVARAIAAGFDTHLVKPETPRAIAAEVQRGLQRLAACVNSG